MKLYKRSPFSDIVTVISFSLKHIVDFFFCIILYLFHLILNKQTKNVFFKALYILTLKFALYYVLFSL